MVVVWKPNRVILASDSKAIYVTSSGREESSVCKIRVLDEFAFAIAGKVEAGLNFDAIDAIYETLTTYGLDKDQLDRRVRGDILRFLVDLAVRFPTVLPREIRREFVVFSVVDFRRVPIRLTRWRIDIEGDWPGKVDIKSDLLSCPGPHPHCYDPPEPLFMGLSDAARSIDNIREPDEVRRSIEAQIRRSPDHVGPPISILEIDEDGPRWVERGTCPEIQN